MWTLKIEVNSTQQFLGKIAIKNNVELIGYPLTYQKEKTHIKITNSGTILGTNTQIKKTIKDLKTSKNTLEIETHKNQIILTTKVPNYFEPLFNPKIIFTEPITINPHTQTHIWTPSSFEKENLTPIIKFAKTHLNAKIIKLTNKKIKTISLQTITPNLSKQQHQALQLAINNGYYQYPKKTTLKQLANKMNISYSTLQEHLKKAESKTLNNLQI